METIGQELRAARERKKVTFDIAAQAIAAYREAIGRYRSPSTRSHGVRK